MAKEIDIEVLVVISESGKVASCAYDLGCAQQSAEVKALTNTMRDTKELWHYGRFKVTMSLPTTSEEQNNE